MKNYNPNQHHIPDHLVEFMMDRFCESHTCRKIFTPTNTAQKHCSQKCGEREIKRRQKTKKRKVQAQLAIYQYARMNGVR